MCCEHWIHALVARLYDELPAEEDRRLSDHLASCQGCRRELAALEETRRLLREAEPVSPLAPRVVVLKPRSVRSSYLAFAAGFACAAVLVASGLAAGWLMAGGTIAGTPSELRPDPSIEPSTLPYEDAIESLRKRVEDQDGRIRALQASAPMHEWLTREDLEGGLTRLQNDLNQRRVEDFQMLLREIAGVELRTGERIGQTQDALRYYVLASHPGITAQ
jgi:hypothetical protein